MKDRIKAIREAFGLSQQKFADKVGVSLNSVQVWEYDKGTPSEAMRFKICNICNVNPLYLSGQSDVMFIPPDEDEEIIDRALAGADPLFKALLLGIVKKPDGWRMLAESIITAADTLRDAGIDLHDKKPGD